VQRPALHARDVSDRRFTHAKHEVGAGQRGRVVRDKNHAGLDVILVGVVTGSAEAGRSLHGDTQLNQYLGGGRRQRRTGLSRS